MDNDSKFRLWFIGIMFAGLTALMAVLIAGTYFENISKQKPCTEQVK